jgi:hypothetical protein
MIKKRINKPKGVSKDFIISIIELHLAETYKTTRISDSRLNIRKLYKFNSANSQEVVHKQMNFKDSGYFIVNDDAIIFMINLRKQFLFWMILLVLGVFVTWKLWNATLLFSFTLITSPILLIWIIGIIKLKEFMSKEFIEISKELGV